MPLPEFPVQEISSWQAPVPPKRHKRRLSWTKVGRQGRVATSCADFSSVRATGADKLARLLKSGDLDQIYYYFLAASGVHGPGVLKCEPRNGLDRAKLKTKSIELLAQKLDKLCESDLEQLHGSDLLEDIKESHTRSGCLGSPSSLKRPLERARSLLLKAIEAGKVTAEEVGEELLELAAQDTLDRLGRSRRLEAQRQKALELERMRREMERVASLHGLSRALEVHTNSHFREECELESMQLEERRQQLFDLQELLRRDNDGNEDDDVVEGAIEVALGRCRQQENILKVPINKNPQAVELLLLAEDRLSQLRLERERMVAMLAKALQSEDLEQLHEALAQSEAKRFTGPLVEKVRIAIDWVGALRAAEDMARVALKGKSLEELDRAIEACEGLGGRGRSRSRSLLQEQLQERRAAIRLEMAEMELKMAMWRSMSSPDWHFMLEEAIEAARRNGVRAELSRYAKGRLVFVQRRREVTASLRTSTEEVRRLQRQREAALRSRGRWEKRRPLNFEEFLNLSSPGYPEAQAEEEPKSLMQSVSSSSSASPLPPPPPQNSDLADVAQEALQSMLQEAQALSSEPRYCSDSCRREEQQEQEQLEALICLAVETLQAEQDHSKQLEAANASKQRSQVTAEEVEVCATATAATAAATVGVAVAVAAAVAAVAAAAAAFMAVALQLEVLKEALLEAEARKLPKALLVKGDLALRDLLEKQVSLRSLRQLEISFDDAEDQPNAEGRQALHRIALVLLQFPEVSCSVHGHRRCRVQCRRIGCQDEDLEDKHAQLSSRRAWNVVQALRAKGCTNEFPTRGWGCQHPIIQNSRRLVR
eukprot:CAMPEP_0206531714 /NCGR_PEP_ID=MMETSP0325_2-20121206/3926_1 /ASSEMBLY_ACC=CAM_ASM_000347 /TAXON_ID=2866 /ORGANISM="Crypthecodinium cohnii, Strain Seligo" /LENGTH=823 /DNA_ID=CAMNT_0054028003 /DNA_START=61 /DNA_END=2528 /DNA_ORIENTATION=-